MLLEQAQRDHDEVAHERLAAIRRALACGEGEEVAKVEHLATQYRLCREELDRIEREAAGDEVEQIERVLGLMDGLSQALRPIRSGR